MDVRGRLARAGEALAADLYARLGFEVVERNYRCADGEIDLVARNGPVVVFCEVKTRKTDRWGEPSEAVGYRKQQRLRRLAARWLRDRRVGRAEVRFDVVSVIVRDGRAHVAHLADAF